MVAGWLRQPICCIIIRMYDQCVVRTSWNIHRWTIRIDVVGIPIGSNANADAIIWIVYNVFIAITAASSATSTGVRLLLPIQYWCLASRMTTTTRSISRRIIRCVWWKSLLIRYIPSYKFETSLIIMLVEKYQFCLFMELTDKNLNFDPPSLGLGVQHVACVAAHISVPPIGSRLTLKYLYQSLKCSLSFTLAWGEFSSNHPKTIK